MGIQKVLAGRVEQRLDNFFKLRVHNQIVKPQNRISRQFHRLFKQFNLSYTQLGILNLSCTLKRLLWQSRTDFWHFPNLIQQML